MPRLTLALLGPLHITLDGRPVTAFESDKVRALLVFLAVEADRPHRREALAGLLWPDLPERAARHNLSQALFNLRQAIGDGAADPPLLLVTRDALRFNQASDHWVDVAAFDVLLAACAAHRHRRLDTCAACAGRQAEAAELYRGSFLAQFGLSDSVAFEEWAVLRRERLQQQALATLDDLAAYHEQRGDYERAAFFATRALELDPWREAAYRRLMRVLALGGDRNAALACYQRCRATLAAELGVEPEPETAALRQRILDPAGAAPSYDPLALPSPRAHNLPPQLTPFLGRERELAHLAELLANPTNRLITIVGPGGIGKTRLALHAAVEQIDGFADGVCFVALAALRDPELLAGAIAEALKLSLHGPATPLSQLVDYLRPRDVLLVLDNFEQLLEAAPQLPDLLRRAPDLVIVATSREPLNVQGEWVVQVDGLSYPAHDGEGTSENYSAVELFVRRAQRARHDFTLGAENQRDVARICRLVEGMPLGVELAAAWVRALSCAEIAGELEHSLELLTSPLRDLPARHRSLRAVFDHSWQLLSSGEQQALRRLTVFEGGFRRDAAEQVAQTALPILAALVDKSLLRRSAAERYDMHGLVLQYGREQLEAAGELAEVQARHGGYFLQLAEAAEPQLAGSDQQQWLDRLEHEHDNLRQSLEWALGQDGDHAARLASALWRFWWTHNHAHEGRRWIERTLAHPHTSTRLRMMLLHRLGVLAHEQCDYQAARASYEESLALRRQHSDTRGIAGSLNSLGVLAMDQGDYGRAAELFEASLALKRELDDGSGISVTLNNLGMVMSALKHYDRAGALYKESLAIDQAIGHRFGVATALGNLGALALDQRDLPEARALFVESLQLFQALGDKDGVAECLEGLAGVASERGPLAARPVARLCGAAAALRQAIGAPLIPVERARFDAITAAARAYLGPAEYAAAWAEGQAMALEQAIAAALAAAGIDGPLQ